jgi:hypothetical protein
MMNTNKIETATRAILRAAEGNPAITPAGLMDEMERCEIEGWLALPEVRHCNIGEWTAAMIRAANRLH